MHGSPHRPESCLWVNEEHRQTDTQTDRQADRETGREHVPIREERGIRDQPLQTETETHRRLPARLWRLWMAADRHKHPDVGRWDRTEDVRRQPNKHRRETKASSSLNCFVPNQPEVQRSPRSRPALGSRLMFRRLRSAESGRAYSRWAFSSTIDPPHPTCPHCVLPAPSLSTSVLIKWVQEQTEVTYLILWVCCSSHRTSPRCLIWIWKRGRVNSESGFFRRFVRRGKVQVFKRDLFAMQPEMKSH